MPSHLKVRDFLIRQADWPKDNQLLSNLRRLVFIVEQQVPQEEEWDGQDETAQHWLATDHQDHGIGTARLLPSGQIGRMAVLAEHRGSGVGAALLEAAVNHARQLGFSSVFLNAQSHALGFYKAAGFSKDGEEFMEAGIPHYRMTLALSPLDVPLQHYAAGTVPSDISLRQTDTTAADYQTRQKNLQPNNVAEQHQGKISDTDHDTDHYTYLLGADSQQLLLRRETEFQQVMIEMCQQARHSIRIWSPLLDHKLFNSAALRDCCSTLARRNRYTTIEILIYDSHRLVTNTHVLLTLSRKLPSSIKIKVVDPELRQLNNEFVLVDAEGVIYRPDHENYEGYANFRDITENNRLSRQFRAAWESGLLDPNIRQLTI